MYLCENTSSNSIVNLDKFYINIRQYINMS